MFEQTQRERYQRRLEALRNERSSWLAHWRDLNDYILPRRGRFVSTDRNKGSKRNENIINNTPTKAARTLSSGMMAGITSPARPWFRLTTPDPELAEFASVRSWLHAVEERIRETFIKSNIYDVLPVQYGDLGVFGTAPALVDEDDDDVLRAYSIPCGQYMLAQSARLQVDTLYREFSLSVSQVVEQFGLEKCSSAIREQYTRGNYDSWVDIVHAIEPNKERDARKADRRGMAWNSCWWEASSSAVENAFLRVGGYREFPVLAPRWGVTGEDVYGYGPGMDALGDIKALQLYERRKAQLVDKLVNPPMVGPTTLRTQRASLLPGDTTYVDTAPGGQKFEPAVTIDPRSVQVVDEAIRQHETRTDSTFYSDLFLMMAQSDRREITAREIDERHEEKMLALGPVLERLHNELLNPLINRTFAILLRRGQLPVPPRELQGVELRVEYISILAQAQKQLGTVAVERLAAFTGSLATIRPDAVDKLNVDGILDEYAGMIGTKPDLLLSGEDVAKVREAKAKQQAAAQQGQALLAATQGAKNLAGADTGGDNALTRISSVLGPVAGAQAGPSAGVPQ